MNGVLSRFVRLFGRQATLADLLALGAFAIGAGVTFLDLVGLWDRLGLKPVEIVVLLLLTALILYSIQEKWEITRRNEDLQRVVESYGALSLLTSEKEVFDGAIEQIRTRRFDIVRIYAPVGLWRSSEAKSRWFRALSEALSQEPQTVTELRAIFGLPPSIETFDEVVASELEPFAEREAARLRYLPPIGSPFKNLPGFGVVILGRDIVGFGFAVHGYHTLVDSTVFVQQTEAVSEVTLWFDGVWETVGKFKLKEARHQVSLHEGLQKARESYTRGFSTVEETDDS